ncbi:hypothetical protein SDJN02_11474, partial [Cucurbita argyrosperma subsp. argyrosperma]
MFKRRVFGDLQHCQVAKSLLVPFGLLLKEKYEEIPAVKGFQNDSDRLELKNNYKSFISSYLIMLIDYREDILGE